MNAPPAERRAARRAVVALPLQYRREDGRAGRAVTRNVSRTGVAFDARDADFAAGDRVELEIAVPASAGVAADDGRIRSRAEVVRVDADGVAARFIDRLRLDF